MPDALIAATALEAGEILATGNARNFRFIDNLRLVAGL
jgi:predicted nucleic acid-binding protein